MTNRYEILNSPHSRPTSFLTKHILIICNGTYEDVHLYYILRARTTLEKPSAFYVLM